MKLTRRIFASVIALIMVMLMLPTAFAAESNVYVLDTTTDLAACDKGAKADGETEVVGDYFTIHYSEKTKIDGSKKNFDDGYTATQRLNFGGKVAFGDTVKNVVEINTSGAATIKLWWVANKDGREMGVFNANGEVLQETAVGSLANALYISEMTVAEAGKYYIGSTSPDGCNYIFKIEVTEAAAEAPVEPEQPENPEKPNPGTGDPMALVMMVSLLSGSALAVLSLKKKEN